MRRSARAFVLITLATCATSAFSQDTTPPAGFWTTPAIHGFGRIHGLPDAAYKPDKSRTYKIVFALTRGAKAADGLNPSLDRVARTVNLYVASGVPLSHLKFVAVANGEATAFALDDTHYRAKFGTANPNLPLIVELRRAGIDVAVCGQAVAENQYDYSWIDESVTLSLSTLTTVTTLQQQGYALMPL